MSLVKCKITKETTDETLLRAISVLDGQLGILSDDAELTLSFVKKDLGALSITMSDEGAVIEYGSIAAALRAVGTVAAGLVKDGETRTETEYFTMLGAMVDCSRNAVMTVEYAKSYITSMAVMGYNLIMLYTEDTYCLPDEPMFGRLRGAYTAEELKEIVAHAEALGVEVVPCIQTLGHMEQILKWKAYDEIKDTRTVMLIDEEKTYELIDKMFAFWSEICNSKRIHIGMDEAHDFAQGKYKKIHGEVDRPALFNKHLGKVLEMCKKYDREPMIWSDMYFRMASKRGDYYDAEAVVSQEVIDAIPDGVQLVYWDYYHKEQEFYEKMINIHEEMAPGTVMASGVWTWSKLWYDSEITENNAVSCVAACRETGCKELIFTLWGDDGAYCDFSSSLSGLALTAEVAFAGTEDRELLSERVNKLMGVNYEAVRKLNIVNGGGLKINGPQTLWDDAVLGMYLNDLAVHHDVDLVATASELEAVVEELSSEVSGLGGDIQHGVATANALAKKVGLTARLRKAVASGSDEDIAELRAFCPKAVEVLIGFMKSFRNMWMSHNKPQGLEVMQVRFAGMIARTKELGRLIGTEGPIPEATLVLLREAHNPPQDAVRGGYKQLATGSGIF